MGCSPVRKLYFILVSILIFIIICYIVFFATVCRIVITYASTYNLGGDFIHYYVAALLAARGKILEVYNTPAFQSAIAK